MGGLIKKATGAIFGNGSDSGLLGTGMYRANRYAIDPNAFNPNSAETKWNELMAARMSGAAPSVAENQLRQGADMAAANAASVAVGARGINPSMGAHLAANANMQAMQQANQTAGQIRAAEMADAAKTYGMQLADQRKSREDMQHLGVQQESNINTVQSGAYSDSAKRRGGFLGGIGEGIASIFSDERVKTDIGSGDEKIKSFLDALSAKKYHYKDESMGEGEFVSPMAQDLEKTELGKNMVIDTPRGKKVDYGHGFGAILAAQANLNKRLEKVEGGKMAGGGLIPGKAKVAGDSVKNDTVNISVSPGEMVIPRSVVEDGPDAIHGFAKALLKRKVA